MENAYKKIGKEIKKEKIFHLPRTVEAEPGEGIEVKIRRILRDNEPISDAAPIMYDDGDDIDINCDITTDKWEVASQESHSIGAKIIEMKNNRIKKDQNETEKQTKVED